MGKFKGNDDAIEDHGGAKTGADAEEEHSAALVAAESLHGSVVDEAEGLAEGLLIREVYPSGGEIVRLGEGTIMDYGAGVAYGDAVVGPVFGGGEDIFGHQFGGHGGTGRNLDGDAVVGRGYLDVGAANVNDEDFHVDLDISSDRWCGFLSYFDFIIVARIIL